MIDYDTFQKIRLHFDHDGLSIAQIARVLGLDERTTAKWTATKTYQPRRATRRASKLDPFRSQVVRLLHEFPYSAQQVLQRLRVSGYTGGYSILKGLVRQLRPPASTPYLTLQFLPGQCAQVDWGSAGWLSVGSTRRRLSFFVLVLAYSRRLYVEFTLAQSMEHFLAAHQNAFEQIGGVPAEVMVDNCKTAVLSHPTGGPATLHPRYLDFAQHYGFTIKPCAPRQPQQKGRVESAVAYIKRNFLAGLELSSLPALSLAARHWLETVANVRLHAQTRQTPMELFRQEAPKLRPLNLQPYAAAVLHTVRANSRCRVTFDTNRYSVPPRYAGQPLVLKVYPDRLVFYHQDQLIAQHTRSYDRHQDYEQAEHLEELLAQRRQGRQQQLLMKFMALSPQAEAYHRHLAERRVNPQHHVQKILALSECYGPDKVARALEDALAYHAFSAEYIANLLAQRERPTPQPGALHLTRQHDLLDLELPEPDCSLYERPQDDEGLEGGVAWTK
jgi:transposase